MPHGGIFHSLSTLTIIMFAMAGIEIIPTFANSVKDASATLYKGLSIAAVLLVLLYILGTIAISIVVPKSQINSAAGLMQTF